MSSIICRLYSVSSRRGAIPYLRNPSLSSSLLRQSVRLKTTKAPRNRQPAPATTAESATAAKKFAYPERLLIYHAGTIKTVFIGIQRVTAIFVFAFFAVFVAPQYVYLPDEPLWKPILIATSGLIPLVIIHRASKPFVCYIHLTLPPYARSSRDMLLRYSASLPPATASLEITTMNSLGRPRIAKIKVADLYPVRTGVWKGGANFARVVSKSEADKKWYQPKVMREFSIGGGPGAAREKGVWALVKKVIEKPQKRG